MCAVANKRLFVLIVWFEPSGQNEIVRFTYDEIVRVAHGERKFAFQRIIISQSEISTHEVRFHHSKSDFTRASEFH